MAPAGPGPYPGLIMAWGGGAGGPAAPGGICIWWGLLWGGMPWGTPPGGPTINCGLCWGWPNICCGWGCIIWGGGPCCCCCCTLIICNLLGIGVADGLVMTWFCCWGEFCGWGGWGCGCCCCCCGDITRLLSMFCKATFVFCWDLKEKNKSYNTSTIL